MPTVAAASPEPRTRGLRAAVRDLLASPAEVEATEERRLSRVQGCVSVADVADRRPAAVAGVVRSVTYRSRETVPALEAEVYDGTGTLRVVWLGRRRIAGVEPGRRVRLEGFVCTQEGRPTMFNPRYELLAATRG